MDALTWRRSRLRAAGFASSTGFARRTRVATEAAGISRRLPWLMRLGLARSCRFCCGRVRCLGRGGRLFNRFRRHLPCGARFGVVLLEAAVFVLAARPAMAPLVSTHTIGHRGSYPKWHLEQ